MVTLSIKRLLLFLATFFQRIRALFSFDNRLHQARFARLTELHQMLSPIPEASGLLLGERNGGYVEVLKSTTRRELGNLLVVGPTRCGKGLLATSQLLSWKHSVVVNDIKGELFYQTAGFRRTLGEVYVIDPTGVGHCFDPLCGKNTEDEFYSVATQLLFKPDEGEGQIFTQRAIGMLTQIFLASRLEGIAPIPYARSLIRTGLTGTVKRLQRIDPLLATQFLDVSFNEAITSDRFLLSAWGTLAARMRPILTETIVRCFTHSDFRVRSLLENSKPVSVYLRWPEKDLLALSPLVRLLWGSLIDELITVYDQRQGRGLQPTLLLIDEAGRTAIPSLADQATTVVGRGISLWVAVQSLSQLEVVYGKARAQVLRDNMESQVYYRPTDLATAQYLERRLGNTSAFARSTTLRHGAEMSEGRSEQSVPLITAQNILQMRDEEIIGFHRHLPPMRLTRMDWRNHLQLSKRRTLKAPDLPQLPQFADMKIENTERMMHELIDPDMIYTDS